MFKGGMGDIMKQAQKMRQDMEKLQSELAEKTVEATAGGGMVTVVANGKNEIISLKIEAEVLKMDDVTMVEDLVKAGVNEALRSSQKMVQEEMGKITGGLGPMAGMLGG